MVTPVVKRILREFANKNRFVLAGAIGVIYLGKISKTDV